MPRRVVKKNISIGSVIARRVRVTTFGLGDCASDSLADLDIAAAWRAVDRRETNIEPVAPGKPTRISRY